MKAPTKTLREIRKILGEAEDDLGIVIRGHFLIENALRDAWNNVAIFPDKFEQKQRYYLDYLAVLSAFGLPGEIEAPCLKLNELRNKFAHHGVWELKNEHVQSIYVLMPDEFKEMHTNDTTIAYFRQNFRWNEGVPRNHLALICVDLSNYITKSTVGFQYERRLILTDLWRITARRRRLLSR
jgi:hypothetical protein